MENIILVYHYIKLTNRAKMLDKVTYISEAILSGITVLINYLTYWVMINKIGGIFAWNTYELEILFVHSTFLFNLGTALFGSTLYNMDDMIIRGELDKYIVKPKNVLFHLVLQNIHYFLLSSSIASLTLMIVLFRIYQFSIGPFKVVYVIATLVGGGLLYGSMYILFLSISFIVQGVGGLHMLIFNVKKLTEFPLSIYSKFIQLILTLLFPLAFISYYPCMFIFDHATGMHYYIGLLTPLIELMIFLLSVKLFKTQMNNYYESTGN